MRRIQEVAGFNGTEWLQVIIKQTINTSDALEGVGA